MESVNQDKIRDFCHCWQILSKCKGTRLLIFQLQNTRLLSMSIDFTIRHDHTGNISIWQHVDKGRHSWKTIKYISVIKPNEISVFDEQIYFRARKNQFSECWSLNILLKYILMELLPLKEKPWGRLDKILTSFEALFSSTPYAKWFRKIPLGKATPWNRYNVSPSCSIWWAWFKQL